MKRKYNLVKDIMPYNRREDILEMVDKYYYIGINENWEYSPHIEIEYYIESAPVPTQPSEYVKITRIIPEIFDSYYTSTLLKLSEFPEEGEYYYKHNINYCELYCYTNHDHIIIKIRNEINYFDCHISRYLGIRSRNSVRKNLETLPKELMKQLYNLTLELLHDPQNFKNLKDDYYKQLSLLIQKREPIKGLILNADAAFYEVRKQITNRIESIENRMINFDDKPQNRYELRGELKGLKFSLKILDGNR